MKDSASDVLQLPLFENLPEELGRRVRDAGCSRDVPKARMIFQEGEEAEAFWALLEGRIKLIRTSRDGRELLVHLVESGQTFAEAALFQDRVYPVSAISLTRCRLWYWPLEQLLSLLRNSPELGLALLGSVASWNRKVLSQLELLTQKRVEERLAMYILGRLGGEGIAGGVEISLGLPKKLVAAVLGMAPEVLSRSLKKLEKSGIIETCGKGLRILKPELLRKLSVGEIDTSPFQHLS